MVRIRRDSALVVAFLFAIPLLVAVSSPPAGAAGVLPHDIIRIGLDGSKYEVMNGDLTKIAFVTEDPLDPADRNAADDVYLLDTVTGLTTMISRVPTNHNVSLDSYEPAISADGTRIAFVSHNRNLVAGVDPDHFDHADVYLHDTATGTTIRVNEHPQGTSATGDSGRPAISADGTKIAYSSIRTNLVADDTNGTYDIFVYDTVAETTTRVSLTDAGFESNGFSRDASLNADGTRIAFTSHATNLVGGDNNGVMADVFVRDTSAGTTIRVSVGPGGVGANSMSDGPSISHDGTRVAFRSFASNLVPADTNGDWDVFVHDTANGATTRASVRSDGTEFSQDVDRPFIDGTGSLVTFMAYGGSHSDVFVHDLASGGTVKASVGDERQRANASSESIALSADGSEVAFGSAASTLVPGDTPRTWDVFVASATCCGDRDGDGLDDDEEAFLGTDPALVDSDADGLTDGEEFRLSADPLEADTDGDTLIDGDEWFMHFTSPLLVDSDGDGLSDADEVAAGTNPSGPTTAVGLVQRSVWDWRLRYEDGSTNAFPFGRPSDVPFMGDWDCDGIDTAGVFRPSNGFAYLRNSNDFGIGDIEFLLGIAGDIPLVGDWDGDGCDSLGLYRHGRVLLSNALVEGPADVEFLFGAPGDGPFVGDFDGDGETEIGVYREGQAFLRFEHTSGIADHSFYFGIEDDVIVAGDWDNDGVDTVGVWRDADEAFYLSNSNDTVVADQVIQLGARGFPVTGDFLRPPGA
jgi:Tol biopolymer transport system component